MKISALKFLIPGLIGLMAGLLLIFLKGPETVNFGDSADYLSAAGSILENHSYPREASLPFFRPPFYPAFIAAIWMLIPGSVLAVKVCQAMLLGLTCCLLYQIGHLIFNDYRISMLGAVIYALNPFSLIPVTDIQTETLHTFLICAAMYFLFKAVQDIRIIRNSLLSGLFWGLATLCRPTALPVIILMCIFIGIRLHVRFQSNQLNLLKPYIHILLASFSVILPWSLMNRLATGDLIFTTDAGGYHLWLGNHPDEINIYERKFPNQDDFNRFSYNYLQVKLVADQISSWESSGIGYRSLSLANREKLWRNAAIQNVINNPTTTLKLWAYKLIAYWTPWLRPAAYGKKLSVISAGLMIPIFALSLFAAIYYSFIEKQQEFVLILAFLFLASTVVHVITHVMIRFRLPYVDPYMALLAGSGVWLVLDWFNSRFQRKLQSI